jgi:hypothetical protein
MQITQAFLKLEIIVLLNCLQIQKTSNEEKEKGKHKALITIHKMK